MTLPYSYNHYEEYQKIIFKQRVKCNYCNKEMNYSSLKRHHDSVACKKIVDKLKTDINDIVTDSKHLTDRNIKEKISRT